MNKKRSWKSGGDWKQKSKKNTGMPAAQKYAQLAVVALILLGLVALFVWIVLPSDPPKTVLYIATVDDSDADVARIPYQARDVHFLKKSFARSATLKTMEENESLLNAITGVQNHPDPETRITSKDTCLIYLSTHGIVESDSDSDGDESEDSYLSAAIKTAEGSESVAAAKLVSTIGRLNARTKIVLLDTGHMFQDPADGKLSNRFPVALQDALSAPGDMAENLSSVWLIASNDFLERPLFSTTRKRTVFSEAVQYALSRGDKGEQVTIARFYTSIASYCKKFGGDSQTPVLYRGGFGRVSEADELSATAFYSTGKMEESADEADEEEKDGEKKEEKQEDAPKESGSVPAVEALAELRENMRASELDVLLETAWRWRDLLESGASLQPPPDPDPDSETASKTSEPNWRPYEFAPTFWHEKINVELADLTRQVLIESSAKQSDDDAKKDEEASGNSKDDFVDNSGRVEKIENRLVDLLELFDELSLPSDEAEPGGAVSDFFARKKRIEQSAANESDSFTQTRKIFRDFSRMRFHANYYLSLYDSLNWFELDGQEEFRESINTLLEQFEKSRSLFPTSFDAPIEVSGSVAERKRILRRIQQADDDVQKFLYGVIRRMPVNQSAQSECVLVALISSPVLKQSEASDRLRERGRLPFREALMQKLRKFPDSIEMAKFDASQEWPNYDDGDRRDRAESRDELLLRFAKLATEFKLEQNAIADFSISRGKKSGSISKTLSDNPALPLAYAIADPQTSDLTDLRFSVRPQAVVLKIVDAPEQARFVKKAGEAIPIAIQLDGGPATVEISAAFVEKDVPFDMENAKLTRESVANLRIDFTPKVTPQKTAASLDEANREYELVVTAKALSDTQKIERKRIWLKLPLRNQIELVAKRSVARQGGTMSSDSESETIDLISDVGQPNDYEFFLRNKFHESQGPLVVSFFASAHDSSVLLPGRINHDYMAESLELIKQDKLELVAKCRVDELPPATKESGKDSLFQIKLLTPAQFDAGAGKPESEEESADEEPDAAPDAEPAPLAIAGSILCRIDDEATGATQVFWVQLIPDAPKMLFRLEQVEREGDGFAIPLSAQSVDAAMVAVNLLDEAGDLLVSEEASLPDDLDDDRLSILSGLDDEYLESTTLSIDVNTWPRRMLFEFDGTRFRRTRFRRVLVNSIRGAAGGGKEGAAESDMFVPLPRDGLVERYGLSASKPRPEKLLVDLIADVSVSDYFTTSRSSSVGLDVRNAEGDRSFRYPRNVQNIVEISADHRFVVRPTASSWNSLEITPARRANSITLTPWLRLSRNSASQGSKEEGRSTELVFDKSAPDIRVFRIVDGRRAYEPGKTLTFKIETRDRGGAGIDQSAGIQFFVSGKKFKAAATPDPATGFAADSIRDETFTIAAPEEPGRYYFTIVASDRVGNSSKPLIDNDKNWIDVVIPEVVEPVEETKGEEEKKEDEAKEGKPPEKVAHTLRIELTFQGGDFEANLADELVVKIEPEVETEGEDGKYVFKGLETGMDYKVSVEAKYGGLSTPVKGGLTYKFESPKQLSAKKKVDVKLVFRAAELCCTDRHVSFYVRVQHESTYSNPGR